VWWTGTHADPPHVATSGAFTNSQTAASCATCRYSCTCALHPSRPYSCIRLYTYELVLRLVYLITTCTAVIVR
jgi:hypothetical protein